jgi:maltose alpha-D-glucosyltransferase/alpha-amylase
MVTDAERDELYAEYARDPKMRRNTGIGRRLAPLLDNNRPLMELFHGLLFSLPGSPILYYGDEIGMGDNIHLGDRDSVRTPMQWSPDRNGGFSSADFEQLYLPLLMDPVYGYQAVNVEAQRRNAGSFLHWIRRMIDARSRHPQLATGSYEAVDVSNPAIYAFIRGPAEFGVTPILCVANLSRQAQPAEVPLAAFEGRTPIELLGKVPFPPITSAAYQLSLPPHGFFWFELT